MCLRPHLTAHLTAHLTRRLHLTTMHLTRCLHLTAHLTMHLTRDGFQLPVLDETFDRAAGRVMRNMLGLWPLLSQESRIFLETVALQQAWNASNAGIEKPTTPTSETSCADEGPMSRQLPEIPADLEPYRKPCDTGWTGKRQPKSGAAVKGHAKDRRTVEAKGYRKTK